MGNSWNVATWRIARREQTAERAKHSDLNYHIGWPQCAGVLSDWRPSKAGNRHGVSVFVENMGDKKAEDVRVQVYLPGWMHGAELPEHFEFYRGTELKFNSAGLRRNAHEGASVLLSRPVYPEQPQSLGLAVVMAPAGTHRIDWLIEASDGVKESTERTALYLTIHDVAVGHSPIEWGSGDNPARAGCPECVRLAWTNSV